MTVDQESTTGEKPPNRVEVQSVEQIPLKPGSFLFNPGHLESVKVVYPDLETSPYLTVYPVEESRGDEFGQLDLEMVGESELVGNQEFVSGVVRQSLQQLKNDLHVVGNAAHLSNRDKNRQNMYEKVKELYLTNRDSFLSFINILKQKGVDVQEIRNAEQQLTSLGNLSQQMFGQ